MRDDLIPYGAPKSQISIKKSAREQYAINHNIASPAVTDAALHGK